MYYELSKRVCHRKWRSFLKAERRRQKRKQLACLRDEEEEKEKAALMADPSYRAWIEEQELLAEEALILEEEAACRQWEEWRARDLELHNLWLKNEEKKKLAIADKRSQEEKIKREWEETVKKEELEKKKKKEEQEALLNEATSHLRQGEATHNPVAPPGYQRVLHEKLEPCPFFLKTGACRFGLNCSREHNYPASSTTILLPNMYTHFCVDGDASDDYDMDLSLEFSETDRQKHFRDFYFDVVPEMEKHGRVTQFKVCCNRSPHLRGNVYVQYEKESAAAAARALFNGRWYAGKQITCILVAIERWKPAICGLYWSQRCPKGSSCNFLHVYRNPGNAFAKADKDYIFHRRKDSPGETSSRRSRRSDRRSRTRSRSKENRRRSSCSSSRSRTSRSRSRDRSKRKEHRRRESRSSREDLKEEITSDSRRYRERERRLEGTSASKRSETKRKSRREKDYTP